MVPDAEGLRLLPDIGPPLTVGRPAAVVGAGVRPGEMIPSTGRFRRCLSGACQIFP